MTQSFGTARAWRALNSRERVRHHEYIVETYETYPFAATGDIYLLRVNTMNSLRPGCRAKIDVRFRISYGYLRLQLPGVLQKFTSNNIEVTIFEYRFNYGQYDSTVLQ